MSFPYALALHEDFLKTCLELLEVADKCANGIVTDSKLATQHGLIETATQRTFSMLSLVQLTAIRLMRNCVIHEGGRRVSRALLAALTAWDPAVEDGRGSPGEAPEACRSETWSRLDMAN